MGVPILFLLGYSLVLGTYEVAKTSRRPNSKSLVRDAIRYDIWKRK